jgi:hypothetical protein
MPPIMSKPSAYAPTSLFYITVGSLTTVWSGIWYAYLRNHSAGDGVARYLCLGCLLTGLILLVIGFAVGPMARWSRQAELPPSEATPPTTAVRTPPIGTQSFTTKSST